MNEIAVVNNNTEVAKFDNFSNISEMSKFAETLIESGFIAKKKVGGSYVNKTPGEVVATILMGKELGLGPISSLNNIYKIDSTTIVGVHVFRTILDMRGIKTKTIRDFEQVTNAEGKVTDVVTTIRFYSPLIKPIDGKDWLEEDVTYAWSMAAAAQLTSKDNWSKLPRLMLWNRCLVVGTRRVTGLPIYETSEIAEVQNKGYKITEDGDAQIID